MGSSASDELHDLQLVAILQNSVGPSVAHDDVAIELDGDSTPRQAEKIE
jgi:hypothetical protein